ncbi:type IV pilus modification protein PilV [Herminiimonas sp. KBW02]|uniref:type IV pilus modification protein PilV n=1 Tax=Herminiimonas sp. KBW02 TaxID=2153363 RepID=UPI000F59673C|nr:type IV pilus modification protein PilV [Herminiimonas sp. KBW02]RQO34635.1 type IV pilus modification protein PilV [Herminiimonas sp. KBW02]
MLRKKFIQRPALDKQAGIMLLEGLIAILVFSLGILALVGMQGVAVKQVTDAKYRSDASMLANQLMGTMWVSNRTPAALKANFDTTSGTSTELTNWKAAVVATLPGVTADENQPTVNVTSLGGVNDGTVTMTIFWRAPGDDASSPVHKYVTVAQIR